MRKFDPQLADLLVQEKATLLRPEHCLKPLRLRSGLRLIDLGAGPGALALPAARLVRPSGFVAAVDVQMAMLERLLARLEREALPVLPICVEEVRLPFPDALFDRALAANVLGELADPVASLAEVRRVLRPEGKFLVVDWRLDAPSGPDPSARLSSEKAAALLRQAGFQPVHQPEVGRAHWALLAVPRVLFSLPSVRYPGHGSSS